jgi:hypothetical protein
MVHQLGDLDPADKQMAISTARTIQAMCTTDFPDPDVKLHAIGLTVKQADAWAFPSAAFKPGEKRADAWWAAYGRSQAELDNLQEVMDELNEEMSIDPAEVGVEVPDAPEVMWGEVNGLQSPLFDTADGYVENTQRLKARKEFA